MSWTPNACSSIRSARLSFHKVMTAPGACSPERSVTRTNIRSVVATRCVRAAEGWSSEWAWSTRMVTGLPSPRPVQQIYSRRQLGHQRRERAEGKSGRLLSGRHPERNDTAGNREAEALGGQPGFSHFGRPCQDDRATAGM